MRLWRVEANRMTKEEIDKLVDETFCGYIEENGPKLMSFMISMMGKQAVKANADTLNLSQEQDIDNKRYKVSVAVTVEEI